MAGQPKNRARIAMMVARSGGEITPAKAKAYIRNGLGSKVLAELSRGIDDPVQTEARTSHMLKPRTPSKAGAMKATNDLDGIVSAITGAADAGDTNRVFQELREEAMKFALELMRMPLDPDERSFSKMLSVKQAITQAVLTATARVRPGDLRDRDDDGVGALLDAVKREGQPERVLTAEEMLD